MKRSNKQELTLMFFSRTDQIGKKNNKSPLQCRIKVDNAPHKDMSTRIDISPDQWDSETNSIKENCPGYDSLKTNIDDFIHSSLPLGEMVAGQRGESHPEPVSGFHPPLPWSFPQKSERHEHGWLMRT